MINIIDTYNKIEKLAEEFSNSDRSGDIYIQLWKGLYKDYPKIVSLCIEDIKECTGDFDFNSFVMPKIRKALIDDFEIIRECRNNFLSICSNLNKKFCKIFTLDKTIEIYFYVGLSNAAGWSVELENQQAVLLGAEKITELEWHDKKTIEGLIYHELSHNAHSILRGKYIGVDFNSNRENAVWHLYIEGFAERGEQLIKQTDNYHKNKNGWLEKCKNLHNNLCSDYLEAIEKDLSTNIFFGDWYKHREISDTGYYLGCEFIKSLENRYEINEIAIMEYPDIETKLVDFLKNNI